MERLLQLLLIPKLSLRIGNMEKFRTKEQPEQLFDFKFSLKNEIVLKY
jgi:hypothetical protein